MTTKPTALILADELEMWTLGEPAAAELRRLYQLCMDQQGEIYALKMARSMEKKTAALVAAAERKRCAQIVQSYMDNEYIDDSGWNVCRDILNDIRAREEK